MIGVITTKMPTLKKLSPLKSESKLNAAFASQTNDDRFSQPPVEKSSVPKRAQPKTSPSYSIASAIERHRNSSKSLLRGNNCEGGAIDIVAVVLSSPNRQESQHQMMASHSKLLQRGSSNSGNSRIHLLIGDNSLSGGKCARVTLSISPSGVSISLATLLGVDGMGGDNALSSADMMSPSKMRKGGGPLGQLQPGDIIRLNKLEVRNDYQYDDSPNKKRKLSEADTTAQSNSLLNVMCDLSMSWRDPVAGPMISRLCRIIPKSSSKDRFELDWEVMETSKEIVLGLAKWYCANGRTLFARASLLIVLLCVQPWFSLPIFLTFFASFVHHIVHCNTSHDSTLSKEKATGYHCAEFTKPRSC